MKIGDRVYHSKMGNGIILSLGTFRAQASAMIDFSYTQESFPLSSLELVEKASKTIESELPTPVETSTASVQSFLTEAREKELLAIKEPKSFVEARKGIVALRLGQILESHVSQLSVGTMEAEEKFNESLNRASQGNPTMIMISGAWGSGKTHLLTLLSSIARRKNFAIATVVMDKGTVNLTDSMALMEAINASLIFPGEKVSRGLSSIISRNDKQNLKSHGATLLASALDSIPKSAWTNIEVHQTLNEYFDLCLSTSRTKAKLYCNGFKSVLLPNLRVSKVLDRPAQFIQLLENWAHCAVASGAHGLVVIMDELDVEYADKKSNGLALRNRQEKRRALLKELKKFKSLDVPVLIAFGAAPGGPGIEKEYDALRDIESNIGGMHYSIKVPEPSEEDLLTLGKNIMQLYEQAYPNDLGNMDFDRKQTLLINIVENHQNDLTPNPRRFVRTILEALDVNANSH